MDTAALPAVAPLSCWVLSDGRRGIENQALGLAEAIGRLRPLTIAAKAIQPEGIMKAASSSLQLALKSSPESYGLTGECPDIAIGCGRQAIAPLRALRKRFSAELFTIYVQDPRISPKHFDLVIAPAHDKLSGKNVISMIGSPNRVTAERMIGETLSFAHALALYPAPRIAMLIGGGSKTHSLDQAAHGKHMEAAQSAILAGYSVMITTSRRTPGFVNKAYRELEKTHENVWFVDPEAGGDNPYFAFLGGADAILVTEDSTNMLTEACASGKPVFTLPMRESSGGPGKFAALYQALTERCHVQPYMGSFAGKAYPPLNETGRVAAMALRAFESR